MYHLRNQELQDSAGVRGRVVDVRGDDLVVTLEQGITVLVPAASVREEDGGFVTTQAFTDAPFTDAATDTTTDTARADAALADTEAGVRAGMDVGVRGRETETLEGETVIPVVEETLEVGRRQRTTGGVRLTKTVHEREEVIEEPTIHEDVEIERVSIDRVVEAPVAVRQEGDTTIYPVLEEVLVTEKRLVLKEEIRVTKRRYETSEPQRVTLRREEVNVEEIGADESAR